MSDWISVKDETPVSGKRVLFFWRTKYGTRKLRTGIGFYTKAKTLDAAAWEDPDFADYDKDDDTYYCPEGWYEEGWILEEIGRVSNVTHWMLLPEPPT